MKNNTTRKVRQLVVRWSCNEPLTILEAIARALPDSSRTSQKQLLRDRCVTCNGSVCTTHSNMVSVGDVVEIFNTGILPPLQQSKVKVLWQDEYFILVHKESGINTIATHEGDKNTVYRIVADYYKSSDIREKIFLLNRLDRETPGLILFARNREIQQEILEQWGKYIISQTFSALVEGEFEDEEGEFASPKTPIKKKQKAGNNEAKSKKETAPVSRRSRATYVVEQSGQWRSLLYITLHGRYNGLRTQLNESGHPTMGEKSKGGILRGAKSLALTQRELVLHHPVTKKRHRFTLPLPEAIKKLMNARLSSSERAAIKEINASSIGRTMNLKTIKPITK